MFEPGRVIAGNAGVLLTEVIWVKPGATDPFVIVDAAMNDLARPALYDAWHDFEAVRADRRDDDRQYRRARSARPATPSRMGREIDVVRGGRPRRVPHRRRLWRDDGHHLQQPRAGARGAGRSGDRFAVVADRIAAETIMARRARAGLAPDEAIARAARSSSSWPGGR